MGIASCLHAKGWLGQHGSLRPGHYNKARYSLTYLFQTTKAGTLHTPQLPALKFFLQTALLPVGSAMYVWGGGWNESDTGAGREACTLGVSPRWKEFAQKQTASYNYRTTRYQIHDGFDCSGYVGWCIYNLFHTTHSSVNSAVSCGYVMPARRMAAEFAARGWGTFIPRSQITAYHAGDIMSSRGHVWIAVGQCDDGSIVLLHSSPPGVRLCGTPGTGHASNSRHPSDTCRTSGSSRIPPVPDITAARQSVLPAITCAHTIPTGTAATRTAPATAATFAITTRCDGIPLGKRLSQIQRASRKCPLPPY